ncbi:MAG: alginate O-acetyltransferase AlgX-related protein [Flavobacteriales bacterium]|jgi:hypothetical protein
MKRALHIALLCSILLGFGVIFYQDYFPIIQEEPLKGYSPPFDKVTFSWEKWWSAEYQEKKEVELTNTFGFRSSFVRFDHQIGWSVFHTSHVNGVIVGKEDYLFEEDYIKAYRGKDYIGDSLVFQRMEKARMVSDTLNKLGKNLILVFAPGKASFYSDYLPDQLKSKVGKTNYAEHKKYAELWHLNFIDFQSWFLEQKNSAVHSLYPKYGIHWSIYSGHLVQDSLIRYIEHIRNIDMPNFSISELKRDRSQDTDFDIGSSMNLFESLCSDTTAIPTVNWEPKEGKDLPRMVSISDSFYWVIYTKGFTNAFGENQFWYYYHDIYPATSRGFQKHSDLILSEEIENHDVFIILGTEANLSEYGWDFIEESYDLFYKK